MVSSDANYVPDGDGVEQGERHPDKLSVTNSVQSCTSTGASNNIELPNSVAYNGHQKYPTGKQQEYANLDHIRRRSLHRRPLYRPSLASGH